ncbi:MAG: SdpI family protein [Lachnospiraceae bacterium]|nr:SdpI family protein [Candidatus Methanomethylophilaceae archaeon]MDD3138712.1 SdpI family protein [Lachnospiraceae bacterium]
MINAESIIYFIIPEMMAVLFVLIGYLMVKTPPGKPNPYIGYRTSSTRKSQDSWDYGQKICGKMFLKVGAILIPLLLLINVSLNVIGGLESLVCMIITMVIELVVLIVGVIYIEREMREYNKSKGL